MGKPKKLDLPIHELINIAKALNENTLSNRNRNQEEKISTDTFIKQFGINRKDFSETIKDTNIKYNKATFKYDFDDKLQSNDKVLPQGKQQSNSKVILKTTKETQHKFQSNSKVILQEGKDIQQEFLSNTEVIPRGNNTEIMVKKEVLEVIKKAIDIEFPDLADMIEQYKKSQEHKNIIEIPQINLDNKKLQGNVISKSFKSYEGVFNDFVKFSEGRKETQKDLIALAIVEFIEKYK